MRTPALSRAPGASRLTVCAAVAARAAFVAAALVAAVISSGSVAGQTGEPPALFPAPFVVEHQTVQTDPDGTTFRTPAVKDYYGGSWIVSVRPDESRVVVNFAWREITEIRPREGAYSVVSFDRLAKLRRRLRALSAPPPSTGEMQATAAGATSAATAAPTIRVEQVVELKSEPPRAGLDERARTLLLRPGVMHVRASAKDAGAVRTQSTQARPSANVEVWLDPGIRFSEQARQALTRFEGEVLGVGGNGVTAATLVAAAREFLGGALPIRTVRTVATGERSQAARIIEDVTLDVVKLDRFPVELLTPPEGFRRVAHPLEIAVSFEETESSRAAAAGTAPQKVVRP